MRPNLHPHSLAFNGTKFGGKATAPSNCIGVVSVVNTLLYYFRFSNFHMFRLNEIPNTKGDCCAKFGEQDKDLGRSEIRSKKTLMFGHIRSLCFTSLFRNSHSGTNFCSDLVLKLIKVSATLFNCFRNKRLSLIRRYFRCLKILKEVFLVNISIKAKICIKNYLNLKSILANLLKNLYLLSQMSDENSPKPVYSPHTPPFSPPPPSPARGEQLPSRGRGLGRGRGGNNNVPPGEAGDGQMRRSSWGNVSGYSPVGSGNRSC